MTLVDQFESVFRAASREVYIFEKIQIQRVLIVTDLAAGESGQFQDQVIPMINMLGDQPPQTIVLAGSQFHTTEDLLTLVHQHQPDLICTYRNLHSDGWRFPHSLGEHLDVLLQKTEQPVLVMPHPQARHSLSVATSPNHKVMVLTDHLTLDHRLVTIGAQMAGYGGALFLSHVEDEGVFHRYLAAISKIPSIDTDDAAFQIKRQLLKEPHDYITACIKGLAASGLGVEVHEHVVFGHQMRICHAMVEEDGIDLLVMNTKDADQLAMHGLAYPLAVEIRHIPLLML